MLFYGSQLSTKPGWPVSLVRSIDVPDAATRAGPHNRNAGQVADPSHGSEVEEDVPGRTTRKHTPCREAMGRKTLTQGRDFRRFLCGSKRQGFAQAHMRSAGGSSDAESFRRGGGTPRRRNRAERRSEAGEIRRPKADQSRLRINKEIFIYREVLQGGRGSFQTAPSGAR